MNSVLDLIKTRRSIRSFRPDLVPDEIVDKIMEAGLYAASGHNKQSTILVYVKDKEMRDRIVKLNAHYLGHNDDGFDPFYGAPQMVIVLYDRVNYNGVCDGSLVMGNLMLAAHELGIGSCWINRAKEEFDSEEGKKILSDMGIEGDYAGVGHCALGYVDGEYPEIMERKPGRIYRF